jgi:hypothetical protein
MKKSIITAFLLFCCFLVYSQNIGYSRTELPLFQVDNKEFTGILDSVISFSENCEGKGLNLLNFWLIIKKVQQNDYQIQITLIDCQGLNFLLTTQNNENKAVGYFIYRNKNFIISGCRDHFELFNPTNSKTVFTTFGSQYIWNIDYTIWNYCYSASDNKFELTRFNPICVPEEKRIFPICNDSLNTKQ